MSKNKEPMSPEAFTFAVIMLFFTIVIAAIVIKHAVEVL